MKNLSLLVWLTQLGLSTAVPLAGFTLLGVWLNNRFGWGIWVVIAGAVLGILFAVDGFRTSLKAMERLASSGKKKILPPFHLTITSKEHAMDIRKQIFGEIAIMAVGQFLKIALMQKTMATTPVTFATMQT